MGQLDRVGVPDHVVGKYNITLASKADTERGPGVEGLVLKAAIRPMPLRIENSGMFRFAIARPVKIATEIEPRQRQVSVGCTDFGVARVLSRNMSTGLLCVETVSIGGAHG